MTRAIVTLAALGFWSDGQEGDAAKLAEAARKATEWKSYRFTVSATVEGGKKGSDPVEGVYEKDKGVYERSAAKESVAMPSRKASTGKDGSWKGKANTKPLAGPHLILADLEKNFVKLEAAAQGPEIVYSGELTAAGRARLLDKLAKTLSGRGETKTSASVAVDRDGNIAKVEIKGSFTGKVKDKEVSVSVTRVIAFFDPNKATLQIPADAQKALDQVP